MKGVSKMSEISKNAWAFLLWSTLAGTISFFIVSMEMEERDVYLSIWN